MHWVIQNNIFQEANYERLLEALQRLSVHHTVVKIVPLTCTFEPEPVIDPGELVYVCGAIKMSMIAQERGWFPGSFMNDKMRYEHWNTVLGSELLNHDAITTTLGAAEFPEPGEFFVRPCKDGKVFSGASFYKAEFDVFRTKLLELSYSVTNKFERVMHQASPETPIMIAPCRAIAREYRFFVVDGKIVTGSMYRLGKRVCQDSNLDSEAVEYVRGILFQYEQPARAFVIDIALTDNGYKVLEYNTINCSGFYASDTYKLVEAIESMRFENEPEGEGIPI